MSRWWGWEVPWLALVWFGSVFRMTLLTLLLLCCWLYCQQCILSFLTLAYFVWFRSTRGSIILLGLTPAEIDLVGFQNCHKGDNSSKSENRFDLLMIQSNVQDPMIKVVQEEKWAGGNSVWYCLFISQTMHFIWFIILHTNVKWHTNK